MTPHAQLIPNSAGFGVHGVRAYLQHCMSHHVFDGLEKNGVEMFIGDVNAHSKDFETHVPILEETFKRCLKWRLTSNGAKCILNNDHSIFLVIKSMVMGIVILKTSAKCGKFEGACKQEAN